MENAFNATEKEGEEAAAVQYQSIFFLFERLLPAPVKTKWRLTESLHATGKEIKPDPFVYAVFLY